MILGAMFRGAFVVGMLLGLGEEALGRAMLLPVAFTKRGFAPSV